MKTLKILPAIALMATLAFTPLNTSADPVAGSAHCNLPAPASPSLPEALQNAMAYGANNFTKNLINVNPADPKALCTPALLRGSQTIFGGAGLFLWRCTNNPTGAFAQEHGNRPSWILNWSNSVPFLVSSLYFKLGSTDLANALYFAGNLATNAQNPTQVLTFSTTLVGELRDTNGVLLGSYHNGEEIATHPVTRVVAVIRDGWFVNNTNEVGLDLTYFKSNLMPSPSYGMSAEFYSVDGSGNKDFSITNFISSYMKFYQNPYWDGANWHFLVDGQDQMGLTYTLERTLSDMNPENIQWTKVMSGPAGELVDPHYDSMAFYRVGQDAPSIPIYKEAFGPQFTPTRMVVNGPE